jgi:Na+/H+ antiporter NhaC
LNGRVIFLLVKCRILKYLKRIIVFILLTFFCIRPSVALDFEEVDSTAYFQGDLPEIESVTQDDKNASITYVKLKKPVNGCLNVFIDEESLECIAFTNGIGILKDINLTEEVAYIYLASFDNAKVSKGKLILQSGKSGIGGLPLWTSILPPLIAILLALIFKEVIVSLFAGILIGSWAVYGFAFTKLPLALFKSIERFIMDAFADWGHGAIIIFSMLIGGMVAIISRNGGMNGVVDKLSKFANSAKNAQLVTWFMGVAIFFDDYANTLIVGNTLRPVTDKFRVSREKLSYIVDSTAAPVAAIALVTTWIGAELGYIRDGLNAMGIAGEKSEYLLFLQSLKYAYYPVFTLIFMFMLIWMNRDFGPMFKAEHRARTTGALSSVESEASINSEDLNPEEGTKHYAFNAIIPVLMVIGMTIVGLLVTGFQSVAEAIVEAGGSLGNLSWGNVWNNMSVLFGNEQTPSFLMKLGKLIGSSDSYVALLWASISGVASAVVLSLATKTLSLQKTIDALLSGFKTMLPTMVILLLAWSLASTTLALHTSDFLIGAFSGNLNAQWVPLITFVLAAIISFSTGSSWSTMAILYPLALPLAWSIGVQNGLTDAEIMPILYNTISVVLAGSVLGDHCSPISDTTVLSSLASSCNHIDHVRTQLPYAITVGILSILIGCVLFALLPIPWYLNYAIGIITLYGIIRWKGKVVPL